MLEKVTIYFIHAMTGCSCCRDENFLQGPYLNEAEPQAIIDKWKVGEGNPLASQYSRFGWYQIREEDAELLEDGRFIVGDRVFDPGVERHSEY